jgi:hypothetical protein
VSRSGIAAFADGKGLLAGLSWRFPFRECDGEIPCKRIAGSRRRRTVQRPQPLRSLPQRTSLLSPRRESRAAVMDGALHDASKARRL